MRKTIVMALITLLVMLVASCDSFITSPGAEKAEYTADGRQLVSLKVKVGGTAGSRALTNTLAKGAANYMEVIFKSGDRYYRTAGLMSQTLTIKIPVDTYNENNAIILIGRQLDQTLLATGTVHTDDQEVTENNTTIRFVIKAFTADLYAKGPPTFAITASTALSAKGFTATKIVDGSFGDTDIFCFQVPTSESDIGATLSISDFGNPANIARTSDDAEVIFTGIASIDVPTPPTIEVDPSDITFNVTTGVGKIAFKFTTTTEGNYIITFNIPVVGFIEFDDSDTSLIVGPGLASQTTWYIRGGTISAPASSQPQPGTGEEGVALSVRTNPLRMVNVNVGPVLPTDW